MKQREVRALHTDKTITVYQAYRPAIADAALSAGRFVPPFKRERMTWIKPSFLWMMYRCGWAAKPGQERVLAIEITREGFGWALSLPRRSLQLGLGGAAVDRYVAEWTVALTDVTDLARTIKAHLSDADEAGAAALLPAERPYPLPAKVAARLGAGT